MYGKEDKTGCVNNIYALAKLHGLKIGEVEDKAGISKGYVSRLKRMGEGSNLQKDTLKKIAEVFDCSTEALLCHDLTNMNREQIYYLDFLRKLLGDTKCDKIVWNYVDYNMRKDFITEEEYENNPYKYFYESAWQENDKGEGISGYSWCSRFLYDEFLGGYAFVDLIEVYTYKMSKEIELIVVGIDSESISEEYYNGGVFAPWTCELYLKKGGEIKPLCAGYTSGEVMNLLCDLFKDIHWGQAERPHLTNDIKEIIDEYMGKEKEDA